MTSVARTRLFDDTALEDQIGYSRAVITGPWIHIAGTTGMNYETTEMPADVVEQADQCLRNIANVLDRAKASWADVVQVRYIFARAEDFKKCWHLFRERFKDVRPAATMFVAELATPAVLVEIEIVAYRRSAH